MAFTATSPSCYTPFLRKPTYGLLPDPLTVQGRRSVSRISSPFPRLQAHKGVASNGKILARDDRKLMPEFDFDRYVRVQTAKVNKALDEALPLQDPVNIHEAMRYSLLAGGKRVRPILCLAACELVGGHDAQAMPVACATEMVHCMSLIHDDLPSLDNDSLRRGQPACHRAFGEATAVLAGDALLCLAFVHVATKTANVSPDRLNRAITELGMASGSKGVAAGQVIDMANTGKNVSLDTLEHIHIHKTSKLLEAAVVCGALVGGADSASQQRLRAYARRLGLLFQVVDDILDATRSSEELGKTAGKDLESDKATYPKLLGLEGARNFAAELLEQANHELAGFDPVKAAPLFHIANFVASRKN